MQHLLDYHNPKSLFRLMSPRCGRECMLCQFLGALLLQSTVLEVLSREEGRGLLVLSAKLTELFRSEEASPLLEKWFPTSPPESIPSELAVQVRALLGQRDARRAVQAFVHGDTTLLVELFHLGDTPGDAHACLVSLREVKPSTQAPAAWRGRLSPRQFEIASLVLLGASNETIASHFETTLGTVKKQVSTIFDKLGVNSRAQLCALAARQR